MTKDEIKAALNSWFSESFGAGTWVARNTDAHNEVFEAKERLVATLSAFASDAEPAPAAAAPASEQTPAAEPEHSQEEPAHG